MVDYMGGLAGSGPNLMSHLPLQPAMHLIRFFLYSGYVGDPLQGPWASGNVVNETRTASAFLSSASAMFI